MRKDSMHAVDLISESLPPEEFPEPPSDGMCCVTGAIGPTVPREHAIKPSFTNLDLLRAPESKRVGIAAWRALNYKWERMSSWQVEGVFTRLDRKGVRAAVLSVDELQGPSACYATTSYKKHGALLAPVNPPGRRVWLWETRLVDCSDRTAVAETWERLRAAQDSGIPRPLIESLDIAPGYMGKVGWRIWRDFEAWARPRMLSPLYQFLTYLLPSKEELKCVTSET
jgi:hypothetical protein